MRARPLAAALAVCVLLLSACGASRNASPGDAIAPAPSAHSGPGHPLPALQDVSCRTWRRADTADRERLLVALEASRAQPVTGRGISGAGTVLSERKARHMLGELCSRPYLQHLRLYRVYALAADFAGTAP